MPPPVPTPTSQVFKPSVLTGKETFPHPGVEKEAFLLPLDFSMLPKLTKRASE